MRILACSSSYGQGGVGQHFAQLVEESRSAGRLYRYYCQQPKPDDAKGYVMERPNWERWVLQYTPARFSTQWRSYLNHELFDRRLAKVLAEPAERFMGFVGKSLQTFQRAEAIGYDHLELVAANSHVENVKRLHEWAGEKTGLRDSWLHDREVRKTLQEYDRADTIYVHSSYTRQSFIEAGIPENKLKRTYLEVAPRFVPPPHRSTDDVFRIVYVGRIEATKGIPLLLEAFSQLPITLKKLTLVGGWSSRRMRRYMEKWTGGNLDIAVAPGDPLPALQQADVFVHPTFEDGFGYAPMEALACGAPVIVTEDTGMKEYVQEGQNGFVVPTGDQEAILEHLVHIAENPLAACRDLTPSPAPHSNS